MYKKIMAELTTYKGVRNYLVFHWLLEQERQELQLNGGLLMEALHHIYNN
ncbi:uncharacterized protein G2W53_033461 [Senna tora]|uniref:Uncharacterized protein n=1 Tax=Senna tora TaxID=362788 RepID=A0A834SYB2_9FABA|nr:uncharacterized protein G2W53_033461 [Senna tora]